MIEQRRGSNGWFVALCAVCLVAAAACGDGNGGDDGDGNGGDAGDRPTADGGTMDVGDAGEDSPEDGGSSADADTSVDAGGDEDTGPPSGTCTRTCEQPSDCGAGSDWVCEEGYCDLHSCSEDSECVVEASQWTQSGCSAGECGTDRVCIEHDGDTFCAAEDEEGSCDHMPHSGFEATSKPSADGSGEVEICAVVDASCDDNTCTWPFQMQPICGGDGECEGDLTCNETTGECVCENDQQCIDTEDGDNWECVE